MRKQLPVLLLFLLQSPFTWSQNNSLSWPLPQTVYILQNLLDPGGNIELDKDEQKIQFRFTPNKRYADTTQRTSYRGDLYGLYYALANGNDSTGNHQYKTVCFAFTDARGKTVLDSVCYPIAAGAILPPGSTRSQLRSLFSLLPNDIRFTLRRRSLRVRFALKNRRWYNSPFLTRYSRFAYYGVLSYVYNNNAKPLKKMVCKYYGANGKRLHTSYIHIKQSDIPRIYQQKLFQLYDNHANPVTHE